MPASSGCLRTKRQRYMKRSRCSGGQSTEASSMSSICTGPLIPAPASGARVPEPIGSGPPALVCGASASRQGMQPQGALPSTCLHKRTSAMRPRAPPAARVRCNVCSWLCCTESASKSSSVPNLLPYHRNFLSFLHDHRCPMHLRQQAATTTLIK